MTQYFSITRFIAQAYLSRLLQYLFCRQCVTGCVMYCIDVDKYELYPQFREPNSEFLILSSKFTCSNSNCCTSEKINTYDCSLMSCNHSISYDRIIITLGLNTVFISVSNTSYIRVTYCWHIWIGTRYIFAVYIHRSILTLGLNIYQHHLKGPLGREGRAIPTAQRWLHACNVLYISIILVGTDHAFTTITTSKLPPLPYIPRHERIKSIEMWNIVLNTNI